MIAIDEELLGMPIAKALASGLNIRVLHQDGKTLNGRDACVLVADRINVDVENGIIVKLWPKG